MQRILLPAFLTLLLSTATTLHAAANTFSLGKAGDLTLTLPEGWQDRSIPAPRADLPPLLKFEAPGVNEAALQMTPVMLRNKKLSDAEVKTMADGIAKRYAGGSVEKKYTLEEIKTDAMLGYVSSFTDADPQPGSFKYVTVGAVRMHDSVVLAVTFLYNDKAGPHPEAFRGLLRGLKLTPAAGSTSRPTQLVIDSPDGKWRLVIPGPWTEQSKNPEKDRTVVKADDDTGGWLLSAYIEPAATKGDATAARDFYLGRMKKSLPPRCRWRS